MTAFLDPSQPYYRPSSLEEKIETLKRSIECIRGQRSGSSLSYKSMLCSYRLEIGTRFVFANMLIEKEEYEKAKTQILEVQELTKQMDDPKETSADLTECQNLLQKINQLTGNILSTEKGS